MDDDDEENKLALSTLSVFFRLKKKDNHRRKNEAEKRTDGKEATKLNRFFFKSSVTPKINVNKYISKSNENINK